jgi:dTDP-4-amino-4,6-dideoxygalactose transaminase
VDWNSGRTEGLSHNFKELVIEMEIPLVDLKTQYAEIGDEIRKAVDAVFESQRFILGSNVKNLEEAIAAYSNVNCAIGVSSGTDALLACLMALDIGPGDGVITSPFSFFATAGVVARLGAQPVFVDIDRSTYNMDHDKLRELLETGCRVDRETGRPVERKTGCIVRAIIPVHLYGQCADMDPIMEMARKARLDIVEDAAQAIGAIYYSKRREAKGERRGVTGQAEGKSDGTTGDELRTACKAGSMGNLGCFSFFPTKNLGGFGDAGMVVTDDEPLAEKVRVLRVHGSQPKYHHHLVGGNFRLDELQAAILNVKFRHLERWTEARRRNAQRYDRLFEETGLAEHIHLPTTKGGNRHIFNQYVIRTPHRDKLREFLGARGVGTEVYYPIPLHLQKCFEYLGYKGGDLPESERAAEETLALPIYPELSQEQQEYVVDQIKTFYERG